MSKLIFRYGAMGSSKTANALMVRYNYMERGQKVILLKPKMENRDGQMILKSRIGLEAECDLVEDFLEQIKKDDSILKEISAIIVDEAQFISSKEVDELADIVDKYNVHVICYGLRTDFLSNLFDGAKRLFELADKIEEVPTICWCGRKAHLNTRVDKNMNALKDGEQILLGGNDTYIPLCRKHYKNGKTVPDKEI